MGKIKLSNRTKDAIKRDWKTLDANRLNNEEQKYLRLVRNGHKSSENNIRFHGKYLGGEIVNIARKVAAKKNLSLSDYLEKNYDEVSNLIDHGYTSTSKKAELVIDMLAGMKRKTVEVDTGNGFVRLNKFKAIEQLTYLMQYAASNTTIVQVGINTKIFTNGKLRVSFPLQESYEDLDTEDFANLLDEFDIFYIDSPKKGKSK